MSRKNRTVRRLIERWIERFGEPPPIRTDPKLMLSILQANARPPTAGGPAEISA